MSVSFRLPDVIPKAPEPYIAHPYSLLQVGGVVGRQTELDLLTDWVTSNRHVPINVSVFSVVAIGGMGKSALTSKWFNDVAPNALLRLAGRIWWSFYDGDAAYENFIIRALAYTAGMSEADARRMDFPAREDALLRQLDTQQFLLVLDGMERLLLAYSSADPAYRLDDDLNEETYNLASGAPAFSHTPACEMPKEAPKSLPLADKPKETYLEKHRLRECADPRAGRFLRRLTKLRTSRVLISTRLFPAEIQTETAQPIPGCYIAFLTGLTNEDALSLWYAFGANGAPEQLLPLFNAFGNFPLLLRALAGEVAEFRPAPGNFEQWQAAHRDFDVGGLPLRNAKSHVLGFALRGLNEQPKRVLHTIAAFRMPVTWEALRALLTPGIDRHNSTQAFFDQLRMKSWSQRVLGSIGRSPAATTRNWTLRSPSWRIAAS
jgi:hypothetical protein